MSEMMPAKESRLITVGMPALFVALWSTGFIGAKFGMPHAEPFTFLALRFAMTSALFALILLLMRTPLPRRRADYGHAAVIGILMHGVYLGGVFYAIDNGMSGGISALIAGLQPILTGVFAVLFLREQLSVRGWLGLALGFFGVTLVVWRQTGDTGGAAGLTAAFISLLGITIATLYQKRFAGGLELRSSLMVQFAAAAGFLGIFAVGSETMHIDWQPEVIFAMAWLVVVLSVGAAILLILLIRRGAASRVASLFYLVPPVVAVETYFLFGETLSVLAIIGMIITVLGVALVIRE